MINGRTKTKEGRKDKNVISTMTHSTNKILPEIHQFTSIEPSLQPEQCKIVSSGAGRTKHKQITNKYQYVCFKTTIKKEYFYYNSIPKICTQNTYYFYKLKCTSTLGQGISWTSKFLCSPLFYLQNPKFNLIFIFTIFNQILILIFPHFGVDITLGKEQKF